MITLRRTVIMTLCVDAIVNAADSTLSPGGGCGAICAAAGPALEQYTKSLRDCLTGDAVLTPRFNLPAHFVMHAVGPVWSCDRVGEPGLLLAVYRSAHA